MKRYCTTAFLLAAVVCAAGFAAYGQSLDQLINALAGPDDPARSEARKLLPRHAPSDAVPRIIPLLAHDNPAVWGAAFNTLADFVHAVGVPGREPERRLVTDALMGLLTPGQPAVIKQRGLRLLPPCIPEGYDVQPIADLLAGDDAMLAEKARAALCETDTREACAALFRALPGAEPAFQCALLNALAQMRRPEAEPVVEALLRSPAPEVRAAAALALAWTGRPKRIPAFKRVRQQASDATAFDAGDALVRLAETILREGGNWDAGIGLFRYVLETEAAPVLRGAALSGLGRYGDETVMADIVQAVNGDGGEALESAALAACAALQGANGAKALIAAYPDLPDGMKLSLISLFGDKQDALFFPILAEAATSYDAYARRAAIDALGRSELPQAAALLADAAGRGEPEEHAAARVHLERLAPLYGQRGQQEAAGLAYLALYRAAETDEAKQAALEGMTQFPVEGSYEILIEHLDDGALEEAPVAMLVGLAKALRDAGREDEAKRALALVDASLNTTAAVREVLQNVRILGGGPKLAHRLGFVTKWQVVGPFPWRMTEGFGEDYINAPEVDLDAQYDVEGEARAWKPVEVRDPAGVINLIQVIGDHGSVCAFAYTRIAVDQVQDVILRAGSDDGIKIWLNGEVVHEHAVDRGSDLDQDQAAGTLEAGVNELLVQCTQGGGGWNFLLRLTRPDGTPLPFQYAE